MNITQTAGKWWIDDEGEPVGPYDTKAEADDTRRGLERFYANENRAGYVVSGRKP